MKLVKLKIYFLLTLSLSSCATMPQLYVTSDVPARIEKNGRVVCSTTPCVIVGQYMANVFGHNCMYGTETLLEAFPLNKSEGYRQSKRVVGLCDQTIDIYFDMNSLGGVNTLEQKGN